MVMLNETPAQWLRRKGIEPPHLMPQAPRSTRRPHLYKQDGVWYCLDGLWLGWGHVAAAAYYAWKRRCSVFSCVHYVDTPLQRRQRQAAQRDLTQYAKV